MMTLRMARARAPSVPGRTGTHSQECVPSGSSIGRMSMNWSSPLSMASKRRQGLARSTSLFMSAFSPFTPQLTSSLVLLSWWGLVSASWPMVISRLEVIWVWQMAECM